MAQLRKDYILNQYVIIASERAKRPDQFASKEQRTLTGTDYFAPGNESMTPEEIGRREDSNGWYIRWFENKFPAVTLQGDPTLQTHNDFYTFADALGHHEVIVESPKIEDELANLSIEHIKELLEVYNERITLLHQLKGIAYVQVFKNHLAPAGTSIVHTHSQVIACNIIPPYVQEKIDATQRRGVCPYEAIIAKEKDSDRRVKEDDDFISFTPYASRFPFEVWIFPKDYAERLEDFTQKQLLNLAAQLKYIVTKLKSMNAPYNMFVHYAPPEKHLRFHIEICPRLTTWAGYELATGIIINPLPPEDAAAFYRK